MSDSSLTTDSSSLISSRFSFPKDPLFEVNERGGVHFSTEFWIGFGNFSGEVGLYVRNLNLIELTLDWVVHIYNYMSVLGHLLLSFLS